MASLLAGTFFAVANYCELGFFLSRGHFGVGRVARRGKHSELAKAVSPSRALPLLATPLFCVVVGVNVLTGCGIRGVEEGSCADLLDSG